MIQTRFRALRAGLLERPDALQASSQVRAVEEGIVGRLSHDFTVYQVLTVRVPGDRGQATHTAFVTFVDPDGVGHEWMVPGPVVQAIARHMEALNRRNRKLKAKQAFSTAAEAEERPGLRAVS